MAASRLARPRLETDRDGYRPHHLVERAVALGAAVVMRPTSIPDGSAFAIIGDPLGNRLGLWSSGSIHSGVGT